MCVARMEDREVANVTDTSTTIPRGRNETESSTTIPRNPPRGHRPRAIHDAEQSGASDVEEDEEAADLSNGGTHPETSLGWDNDEGSVTSNAADLNDSGDSGSTQQPPTRPTCPHRRRRSTSQEPPTRPTLRTRPRHRGSFSTGDIAPTLRMRRTISQDDSSSVNEAGLMPTQVDRNNQLHGTGGVSKGQTNTEMDGTDWVEHIYGRALEKLGLEADDTVVAEIVNRLFGDTCNTFASELARHQQSLAVIARERAEKELAQRDFRDAKRLVMQRSELQENKIFKASGIAGEGGNKKAVFDEENKLVVTFEYVTLFRCTALGMAFRPVTHFALLSRLFVSLDRKCADIFRPQLDDEVYLSLLLHSKSECPYILGAKGVFIIEDPSEDVLDFGWPTQYTSVKEELDTWRNTQLPEIKSLFCTLSEYCDGGNLMDFAHQDVLVQAEPEAKVRVLAQLFLQALFGLLTVHEKCGYLHKDVKLQVRLRKALASNARWFVSRELTILYVSIFSTEYFCSAPWRILRRRLSAWRNILHV